jgi:hypothetical protein
MWNAWSITSNHLVMIAWLRQVSHYHPLSMKRSNSMVEPDTMVTTLSCSWEVIWCAPYNPRICFVQGKCTTATRFWVFQGPISLSCFFMLISSYILFPVSPFFLLLTLELQLCLVWQFLCHALHSDQGLFLMLCWSYLEVLYILKFYKTSDLSSADSFQWFLLVSRNWQCAPQIVFDFLASPQTFAMNGGCI